jgi:hypothetical protein
MPPSQNSLVPQVKEFKFQLEYDEPSGGQEKTNAKNNDTTTVTLCDCD